MRKQIKQIKVTWQKNMLKNKSSSPLQILGTVLLAVSLSLLNGCSASVNPERYSLIEDLPALASSNPYDLQVRISATLASGGIIMQTSPYTVVSAKNHRWALRLEDQLSALLNHSLLKADQAATQAHHPLIRDYLEDKQLNLSVTAFQGTLTGQASIKALLSVKDSSGQTLFTKEQDSLIPLQADGYPALCQALQQGFTQIRTSFAESLASFTQDPASHPDPQSSPAKSL